MGQRFPQLTLWNSHWCKLSSSGFSKPVEILRLLCLISCAPQDKESHASVHRLGLPSYTFSYTFTYHIKPLTVYLSLFHMKHKSPWYCWKCRNAFLPVFFTALWHNMKSGICSTKPKVVKLLIFLWLTLHLDDTAYHTILLTCDHASSHVTALKLVFILYFANEYGSSLKI